MQGTGGSNVLACRGYTPTIRAMHALIAYYIILRRNIRSVVGLNYPPYLHFDVGTGGILCKFSSLLCKIYTVSFVRIRSLFSY